MELGRKERMGRGMGWWFLKEVGGSRGGGLGGGGVRPTGWDE